MVPDQFSPKSWPECPAHFAGLTWIESHFASGRDDALVTVKPVLDRAGDFARLLEPDNADEQRFAMIRRSESTGRPLATAEFVAGLERLLGRPIARRAPGRKPKSSDAEQQKLL